MDISLITSLYRSSDYLESYLTHLLPVIDAVLEAGKSLEVIIIVNDATPQERALLGAIPRMYADHIHVHYVPRETLYATWNRGVNLAQGQAIGFWNVDDIRTVEGLIEAHEYISSGCHVYYAPYEIRSEVVHFGIPDQQYVRVHQVPEFEREVFTRYPIAGPFFMFSKHIYEEYGGFDERFRALGDFEWWVRIAKTVDYCRGEVVSGTFLFDGTNLSMDKQMAFGEENMVHLLHGNYDRLRWMNPDVLQEMFTRWGDDVPDVPTDIYEQHIGDSAKKRWQSQVWRRILFPPASITMIRLVINRIGIRYILFKLGIVQSQYPY